MLFSLTSLATLWLTAGASWLSDSMGEPPMHSGNAPVAPQDPSTLTLALIGAGTIAIYLAAKWRPSRADVGRWTGRLSDQPQRANAEDGVEERRSRGAA